MTLADDATSTWIRRFHPTTIAATRLVCFPHAGGSASYFHPVSVRFSPDVDVVALQYPGRQDRRHEPLIPDIEVLADRITAELLNLGEKPTVLFGHSMGAVLAFETARRLERAGAGPRSVMASGRRAPSTQRREKVHQLADDEVIRELKALNGTTSALLDDEEIIRMSLPAVRNDYTAVETYSCPPGRRITAPIVALTGDADPKTTLDEADRWRQHTDGAFRREVFPGGHFFLAERADDVAREIAAELAAVPARP